MKLMKHNAFSIYHLLASLGTDGSLAMLYMVPHIGCVYDQLRA